MPTPPEIVLHQFPALGRYRSASPFCQKVHAALRIKGLAYTARDRLMPPEVRRVNPRGKLPVLDYGPERIPDSTNILRFLEARHPNPPLQPESPRDRAWAALLEDWADESLYWFFLWQRWGQPEGAAKIPEMFFGRFPAPVRSLMARPAVFMLRRQMRAQGVGRRPPGEILADFHRQLDWIDALLEGREWLVGDRPGWADLAAGSQLVGLTMEDWLPEAAQELRNRANLWRWLARQMEWYVDLER